MTEPTNHKTVLGADCRITGELSLDNDAVIMGHFDGTLRVTGVLELTDSAKVTGTIIAGALKLAGTIDGNVVAEHGAELMAGAHFNGQLYTTRLNVIEGAVFQGDICVGPKAMQAAGTLLQQAEQAVGNGSACSTGSNTMSTSAPSQYEAQDIADQQEEAAWDDQTQEQTPEDATPASTVRTVSSSLNSILERRRSKPMPAAKPAGAIRSGAQSAERVA